MSIGLVLLALFALSVATYALARRKVLAAVAGGRLNSLPGYYGSYVALWTGVPAVMLLFLMLLAGERLPGRDYVPALALVLAAAGALWAYPKVRPAFRARARVDGWVRNLLLACSGVAVLTTAGILLSLLYESLRFFDAVSPLSFLFGTQWSPQIALRADQAGAPDVAGTALRPRQVQRHGLRTDHGEDRSGRLLPHGHHSPAVQPDAPSHTGSGQQGEPDEARHVVGAGPAVHLSRGAGLDDRAVLDDHDPVGECHGVDRIMGHQDGAPAELGQVPAQLGADGQPGPRVQRRQRLVEQEERRFADERTGQGGPLRLAARQFRRPPVAQPIEAHPGQPGSRRRPRRRPPGPPGAQPEGHVVGDAQVREEQGVLEDDAEPTAVRREVRRPRRPREPRRR